MSALSQGIINLTSLAREIQPEIEESLKKSAKSGAIVMALKRISDNQEFLSTHKIVRVLKNLGDITVRSSLADYCFKITDTLLLTQAKFLDQIKSEPNAFYTSSRGVGECNIIVSQNLIAVVDNTFKSEMCIDKEGMFWSNHSLGLGGTFHHQRQQCLHGLRFQKNLNIYPLLSFQKC